MPVNPYFNENSFPPEQQLYEDLTIETIQIYGRDFYYIPRKLVNLNKLYGEDTISRYEGSHKIEMYISTVDGFEGERDFIAKFGLEIRDQATFVVARKRFEQEVDQDRPKEGDLIYFPLTNSLFEIQFVEHENPFYQLGRLYSYELKCELFRFSEEDFDSGIPEVDAIDERFGYSFDVVLEDYSGGLSIKDRVFQGDTLADSTAEATVISIDETAGLITLAKSKGTWNPDLPLKDGTAQWTILDIEDFLPNDPVADNKYLEEKGKDIIDFDVKNPFGEV
jgi:hypothetical protein